MRPLAIFALLSAVVSMPAVPAGDFAKSGRMLTIEQWRSSEGMTWAVLERQLVVYRMSDYVYGKEALVASKPLTPEQSRAIKEAIAGLPEDALGYLHDAGLSTGAPMLRLGFRSDAAIDRRGIEVHGYFPAWLEEIVRLVSSAAEPEARITFHQLISDYRAKINAGTASPDIQKVELRLRYGEPKP